ncbi:MAG: hypothetical protein ACK417_06960 [Bacteroidia bacterium]|jgi:hypothetical protein
METVIIQIHNQKAYKLLDELEALNLLKVIRKSVTKPQRLSDKYAGKLSADVAEELQAFVQEGRETWGKSDT